MKAEAPERIGRILLLVEGAEDLAGAAAHRPDALIVEASCLADGRVPSVPVPIWVRVRPIASEQAEVDLDAAVAAGATGVLACGVKTAAEVERLGARLAVREAEHGLPDGAVRILAAFGDNAAGILAAERLGRDRLPRLAGLVCDTERLAEALACPTGSPVVAAAEARLLLSAVASGLPALKLLASEGAETTARGARDAGYAAVIARDASALEAIRKAFTA